jgi:hypothetical protein
MKAIDIRKDIHLLIDSIENENLLKNFYDLLSHSIAKKKTAYGINYRKVKRKNCFYHLKKVLWKPI